MELIFLTHHSKFRVGTQVIAPTEVALTQRGLRRGRCPSNRGKSAVAASQHQRDTASFVLNGKHVARQQPGWQQNFRIGLAAANKVASMSPGGNQGGNRIPGSVLQLPTRFT